MQMRPLLRQNLQEIWSAVNATSPSNEKPLPLVANYAGTRLYDARGGFGRLWSWFYSIIGIFGGSEIKNEKLRRAVVHTHNVFQSQLEDLQPVVQDYQEHLQNLSKGFDFKESDFGDSKRKIIEWNLSTRQFVKLMQKQTDPTTQQITHVGLRTLLNGIASNDQSASSFISSETRKN